MKLFKLALDTIQSKGYYKDAALIAAVESKTGEDVKVFTDDLKAAMTLEIESSKDVSLEAHVKDSSMAIEAATQAAAIVGAKDRSKLYGFTGKAQEQSFGDDLSVDSNVSVEHFDGRMIDVFQAATFAYNVEAATQDGFSEAFFPTVIGDVNTGGVKLSIRSTKVMNDFLRNNISPDGKKFKRKSLITALSDQGGILGSDQLRLLPAVGGAFDDILVLDLKKDKYYDAAGVEIETAPYKLDTTLNVIGAGQSDTLLAKGVMDHTDTLDSNIKVEALYFATTDAAMFVKVDTSHLAGASFVASQRGDSKDVGLNSTSQIAIDLQGATDYITGDPIAGLTALPAGTKAIIDIDLFGNGNAADGDLSVTVGSVRLVKVVGVNGVTIPDSDANYAAIKTEIDAIIAGATGVDLGARITNSNLRRKGIHITTTLNSEILPVAVKTPIYTESPVAMQNVGDHDGAFVNDLLSVTGIISNFSAVKTITGFANFMRGQAGIATGDIQTGAIGQANVNPYFKSIAMKLDFFVDGNRSGQRREDVQGALVNNIASEVAAMLSTSGFNNYKNYVSRNGKTEIVIGTYPALAAFLGDSIDLGNGCTGKVVSTDNTEIDGKIYVTVTGGTNNAQDIAVDRFGSRLFVPSLVTHIATSENGATSNKTVVNPLESHLVTLPILVEFNVTGLDSVLRKTTHIERVPAQ